MPSPARDTPRVALVSCRQRGEERQRTLASYRAIGLPVVFEPYLNDCTKRADTGGQHGRVWFEKALQDALDDDLPGVVISEDDVDVKPDLIPAAQLAAARDVFVDFCIWRPNHHPPVIAEAIAARRAIRPDLYLLEKPRKWYGTQCVYVPAWLARFYFKHQGRASGHAFDSVLTDAIAAGGFPIYGAYPNPVQHRNPHSMAELVRGRVPRGGDRVSDTFDLPPAHDWAERVREWRNRDG